MRGWLGRDSTGMEGPAAGIVVARNGVYTDQEDMRARFRALGFGGAEMRRAFWLSAICLIAVNVSPALAERFARSLESLVSRPAERAASVYIGGEYTQTRPLQGLLAARQDVSLLGNSQFEYTRHQQRGVRGRVLSLSTVGLSRELSGPDGVPLSNFAYRSGEIALISGLSDAMDFRLPPPGAGAGGLPTLNAYLYTPQPLRTEFEEIFDLQPKPKPTPDESRRFTSVAEELERQMQERVARTREVAMTLWTRATVERRDLQTGRYPTCEDCDALLSNAAHQFQAVRDLDNTDARPLLFLFHIALEQDRPSLAGTYLIDAFRRDPLMFQEPMDEFANAFGDYDEEQGRSLVLDSQLHRYKDIGRYNPRSVTAQLVGAYCAWQLDEVAHARESVEQALELARQKPEGAEAELGFVAAMQAALR